MIRALVDEDIQPPSRITEAAGDQLEVSIGVPTQEDALIQALSGRDVLFCTSRIPVTRHVLKETDLDVVAKIGTGIDNIDLVAAEEFGIPVTYTPGSNAMAVAEHTVALMLGVGNRIVEADSALTTGVWRDELPLGTAVFEATVGIIGFGNVGRRVASLLTGFHTDTRAYDPYVQAIDTEYSGAHLEASLTPLLTDSDFLAITAELTPETRGLIGPSEFKSMKNTAILVNTARGPIIQTDALLDALRSDEIAGAGLDVFDHEPLPASSPLHEFDSVITTPHAAAAKTNSRHRTIDLIVQNTLSLLHGDPITDRFLATSNN